MYNDRAKALWDTAVVEKKFGVRPDQLADYLALTGDASAKGSLSLTTTEVSARSVMERRSPEPSPSVG